jgi:hypothetical protein
MSDKIENRTQPAKDQESTLSNAAFDLLKGAAAGAVAGAQLARDHQTVIEIGAGVVGGAVGAAAAKAAIVGAQHLDKDTVQKAAAAAAGGVGGVIGQEIAKENKKEIQAVGDAIKNEVKRQVKEITDTPKDVMDHVKKRPVTAAAETIIFGPGATILDAKLRKWLGW